MESATSKSRARPYRLSFDISATLFEEKEAMAYHSDSARKLFKAEGSCSSRKIDKFSLITKMLDALEAVHGGPAQNQL